jgi:hypothetical protein
MLLNDALNPDDKTVHQSLPITRQQKFNKKLIIVARKYKGTELYKELSKCKSSEPLPSKPYVLPKDHKQGELKGRPIISTCQSVVRPLSQWLVNFLNHLVRGHVESHMESTDEFVNAIRNITILPDYSFGSLDVTNLYGSIPLTGDQIHSPGLITIIKQFFFTHRHTSLFPYLHPNDLKSILYLTLYEDVYLYNGQFKTQTKGIAMGNCAAPPLAIIYMDDVERCIKDISPEIIFC